MKKKVLFIAAILTAGLTFGQDGMTSKKGTPILPEAGDYAIGFDAGNLLNYGGNLLNGSAGNGLNNLNLMQNNTIYGKMFIDANKAYRGMLQIGFGSVTERALTADLSSGAAAGAQVEDEMKTSAMNIVLGGGIEMRRGAGRLQGVYGPMAMIMIGSGSTEYTYGNALSATNPAHVSNFGQNAGATEDKQGGTFGFAVGGFAGVEYFFAPKMSLGAEIQWTIAINSEANGEETTETWNGSAAESTTTETGGESSFNIGTVPNGVISLNFHF